MANGPRISLQTCEATEAVQQSWEDRSAGWRVPPGDRQAFEALVRWAVTSASKTDGAVVTAVRRLRRDTELTAA